MDTTGWTYRYNSDSENWAGNGEILDTTGEVVLADGDSVTGPGNREFRVSQVWSEDNELWVEGHWADSDPDDTCAEVLRVADLEALEPR